MCTTKNKNTIPDASVLPLSHLIVFPMYYSTPSINHIQHPIDKRWFTCAAVSQPQRVHVHQARGSRRLVEKSRRTRRLGRAPSVPLVNGQVSTTALKASVHATGAGNGPPRGTRAVQPAKKRGEGLAPGHTVNLDSPPIDKLSTAFPPCSHPGIISPPDSRVPPRAHPRASVQLSRPCGIIKVWNTLTC
jgi:hypothetical protein